MATGIVKLVSSQECDSSLLYGRRLTASLRCLVISPVENEEDRGSACRDDNGEHSVLSNQAYQRIVLRFGAQLYLQALTPHRQLSP